MIFDDNNIPISRARELQARALPRAHPAARVVDDLDFFSIFFFEKVFRKLFLKTFFETFLKNLRPRGCDFGNDLLEL